jgi:hypothetical protein
MPDSMNVATYPMGKCFFGYIHMLPPSLPTLFSAPRVLASNLANAAG